jgi:hypothetical protein
MEVMRANQKKVAMSLAGIGRSDTRDVKRGLAIVPFRHSKLTEILGDYFVNDGRAVSIFFFFCENLETWILANNGVGYDCKCQSIRHRLR